MAIREAQAAIAQLIDWAQRGEIDPWNVAVIEVVDRFLSQLPAFEPDAEDSAAATDLARSGQAFLWGSRLVAFKAQTLQAAESDPAEGAQASPEAEALDAELDGAEAGEAPAALSGAARWEHGIRRRRSALPPRQRRVTLPELIGQLRQIASEIEASESQGRARREPSPPASEAAVAELAHQEDFSAVAARLERFLGEQLPQYWSGPDWGISLEQLLVWWQQAAGEAAAGDRVETFWALLWLAARSQVELWQAALYQELYIRPQIGSSGTGKLESDGIARERVSAEPVEE